MIVTINSTCGTEEDYYRIYFFKDGYVCFDRISKYKACALCKIGTCNVFCKSCEEILKGCE